MGSSARGAMQDYGTKELETAVSMIVSRDGDTWRVRGK